MTKTNYFKIVDKKPTHTHTHESERARGQFNYMHDVHMRECIVYALVWYMNVHTCNVQKLLIKYIGFACIPMRVCISVFVCSFSAFLSPSLCFLFYLLLFVTFSVMSKCLQRGIHQA